MRGKAGSGAEFHERSDIVVQRTRHHYPQRQVFDTSKGVDTSSIDGFRQSGKSSEVFGIGSGSDVSRKGAFSKDLFGEVEDTRVA